MPTPRPSCAQGVVSVRPPPWDLNLSQTWHPGLEQTRCLVSCEGSQSLWESQGAGLRSHGAGRNAHPFDQRPTNLGDSFPRMEKKTQYWGLYEIIEAQKKDKTYIHRQVASVGEDSRYRRCPHCYRGELLVKANEGCGHVLLELCLLRPSKSLWWL